MSTKPLDDELDRCNSCGQFPWDEPCTHCGGDGFEPNTADETCTECHGSGDILVCECTRHYQDWEIGLPPAVSAKRKGEQ
jgi:hypothetical protein